MGPSPEMLWNAAKMKSRSRWVSNTCSCRVVVPFVLPICIVAIPCSALWTSETILCLRVTAPTRWFQIFVFFHPDCWENDPFSKIICPDPILWLVIRTNCPGCYFSMSCMDFTHRNELGNPAGAYNVMYMAIMCINIVSTGQFNSTLNQWMFGPQNLFFYSKDQGIQPMPLLGKGMRLSLSHFLW